MFNEDGYSATATWWRNTLDHRFFSVVEWDRTDYRPAVVDDFGNLVRVNEIFLWSI